MKDASIKWYYESDGEEHNKTYYLCNDAIEGDGRIDQYSKRNAIALRDDLNAPIPAGETLSAHVVRLLERAWPNLNIEGWDTQSAEYIVRTAIAKTTGCCSTQA